MFYVTPNRLPLWIAVLPAIVLAVLLAGCGSSAAGDEQLSGIFSRYPELKGRAYETVEVKRVVDGDTFETAGGDKVRLIGMNTPETVKPNSAVEQYGKEASAYTKERLTGKTVHMFKDAGNTDKYGRLLRYVFIKGESEMFNVTLLKEGYANTMTVPPNVMFAGMFVEIEREARANGKGLWGKENSSGAKSGTSDGKSGQNGSSAAASCKNPQIKGNINSKNEKIYHLPGGKSYNQTKAELMFCTEEEASAAGFRKAAE